MLKRKMIRDIIKYKVQFISIFLMAFIGVLVFTGMYADTLSFETTIDDYYEQTNLADGWIYSNYLVDEFLNQTNYLGATTQMERQLVVDSQADLVNMPDITLHFVENNTISKFYVVEGKALDINDSNGVWLDKSFADARHLKIGDEITFESNGIEITKIIRGIGYSPEYIHDSHTGTTVPDYNSSGFAHMSHKAFPSDNITYNVLLVKFDGNSETYQKLLDYRLGDYYTSFLDRDNQQSVYAVDESVSQLLSLSFVFPPLFIIISMLMLLTTMKRIISNQRTQIGVLKANGFRNNSIAWHYLLSGFILVTLGAVAGVILGPKIFHMLSNPSRILYFKYPYWHSIDICSYAIIIPLIGAISLIVSYFSIKTIVNEPPSSIIKPKVPSSSGLSFIEKLKLWEKVPFNLRWNFRNIKRNKFRSIMTIIGVIGCSVLLLSGFGLYEKMDDSKDWYFNDVNHFESKLVIEDNMSISQIDSIAEKVNGDPIMESSIEISKNDTQLASLLVLNGTDLITITNDNHDKIEIPNNEVSISKKMANTMGINVGDTIDCKLLGSNEDIKIKIDRMHSSPFSQGLVMSPDKLEELGMDYNPTSVVTSQHVNESYDGISVVYKNDLIEGWDTMEQTTIIIITALVFFAVVLALVILYNLNLLSYTEMKNDIATLKVLGFKSNYLTGILLAQNLFFIIVGFIVGIPLAYQVLSILIPAFGDNFYLIPSISLENMIISFIIIVSSSIITSLFFSRKIRKLNMVDSLKDLER